MIVARHKLPILMLLLVAGMFCCGASLSAQVVIEGETVYTMAGPKIDNGVVVIKDGKISAIGKAGDVVVPPDFEVLRAKVVTPGLVDAHSTVGLSGILNVDQDQDQLEHSDPIQPQLRAVDAYNGSDELIEWIRGHGVTTVHTGHAAGELISGQTMITKTIGNTVEENLLNGQCSVAATLTSAARKSEAKSPGTRGKMISMLRDELIKAQQYVRKHQAAATADDSAARDSDADASDADEGDVKDSDEKDKEQSGALPDRDLRLETLGQVLSGEIKLMITADRAGHCQRASLGRRIRHQDLVGWWRRELSPDQRNQSSGNSRVDSSDHAALRRRSRESKF